MQEFPFGINKVHLYLYIHQTALIAFYFSLLHIFLQIDQEGLTLPERSLYLGQDEDSVKVNKIQGFYLLFFDVIS